ncbi:glycosyltransferase family 2 protein [Nostoc sp.]|uniref:glycosyltransferase family 2 protein n=1 Tax=Nostoc sp. TaxID=1180 RepID=UPI002FFCE7A1
MAIVNTILTLKDLPTPPEGKTGWPWTEQTEPFPDKMPDGSEWPRITIVTPSYNQGQFIEETIRSVLLQGCPNLEYIIIDGGSTDNSIEIIKKYEPYLAYWISEPDRGQSHALNKGFCRVTGRLVGWQNSDDYYHPKALLYAAQALSIFSDADVFYGNLNHVDENRGLLFSCKIEQFELKNMLPWQCIFNQSSFFKKELFQEVNFLNETKQHIMDYDFFWRLILSGYRFKFIPEIVASYREHSNTKGNTQTDIADREFFEEYKFLYKETDLNSDVKEKILNCMLNCCLNDFWKLKLGTFRKHVREVITISGLNHLRIELILKYLISFTGSKNILFIKLLIQNPNKY